MGTDDIKGFRLMTEKEYRHNEEYVPPVKGIWWLGTPGLNRMSVMVVCGDRISPMGIAVDARHVGVRPVMIMEEPVEEGSRLELLGESWTAFLPDAFICDRIVLSGCFNAQKLAEWATDYKGSSVERQILRWAKERGCPLEVPEVSTRSSKIRLVTTPVSMHGITPIYPDLRDRK